MLTRCRRIAGALHEVGCLCTLRPWLAPRCVPDAQLPMLLLGWLGIQTVPDDAG